MDRQITKLVRLGIEQEVAQRLVEAALDTPRKIKAASDAELERVHGVGPSKRGDLRQRFPKPKGRP